MGKKIRFSIRVKLAIMSMVTIAVAVVSLGISLSISYSNAAYESAESTLKSVSTNASLSLDKSIQSADTSMKLLANQIGYDHDFANSILTANEEDSNNNLKNAMAGSDRSGDGSTIIGAMDYLIVSDPDIESATMYSWFVEGDIFSRLRPATESKIELTEERKSALFEHSGRSYWFFTDDGNLYVWRAIVNFGVEDTNNMQVVGFIEYGFDRTRFLERITDTRYENQGMYLFDENGKNILSVSCSDKNIDKAVLDLPNSLNSGTKKYNNYTVFKNTISSKEWTYITFINHKSIQKTVNRSSNLTIIIVAASVLGAALVSFLLTAKEVKRIKKLSRVAGEISNGNYDVRLDNTSNDEITDVGESFNVMAERVQEVLEELILQQDSISENFATILSNKSGESGNHVKRVSEYSAILAEEMGFDANQTHDIRIASMLHDVGKIMIDESILHKPGRFTDEEYKIMQQHVVYGGKLLQGVPGNIMQLGAIIALYHHERWDGNGYVNHLKGDEIPKEAQITSVADVFDALVSRRCYKGAWTIEEAYNEIVSQSGKQFSPAAVEAFQRRFEDFKRISIELKDEE